MLITDERYRKVVPSVAQTTGEHCDEATDEAVMNSGDAHQNQQMQNMNNSEIQQTFQRVIFDMLRAILA